MQYAAKLIQYVLIAVLGSTGAAALVTGGVDNRTVVFGLIITALTAAVAFLKANTLPQPHAKAVIAVFGATVLAIVDAWTDHRITPAEWIQVLLALVGAINIPFTYNLGDHYDQVTKGIPVEHRA